MLPAAGGEKGARRRGMLRRIKIVLRIGLSGFRNTHSEVSSKWLPGGIGKRARGTKRSFVYEKISFVEI
jgi:hypothetical protein